MERKIRFMQTLYLLITNVLILKSLALPLANNPTFTSSFAKFCLRIESFLVAFTNENPLYFSHLSFTRLQYRLQTCLLSSLTCLQVQEVSFAVCKDKMIENHSVNKFSFESLFAQIKLRK